MWAFPPFSAEDPTDRDRGPRSTFFEVTLRSFLHGTVRYSIIWPENPDFNPILSLRDMCRAGLPFMWLGFADHFP